MVADLGHMRQSVHDSDQKDFSVPDLPDCLHEIDDRLFQPEVFQACLVPSTSLAAQLARSDDFRGRIEDWHAAAHLQMLDPAEVDVLEQLDKAAFWIG
jgi:hypothetical protein